ncbi:lysophospholipid transporter LplT [Trinickia caryophylli]|uniref:Major Facilitator Superfamily protein n=2 Tax=Trinickia caryophylli TaxID=28094 RepID=A0A1X7DGW4_TRICW|nr:lysophospholipid transporter LplT [Trinickia caryophylli]PMS12368.1 lysophospholipid transporter LplT [Trinickia caryophylli]TRX16956.1 lysophospholipid transporter LplT [Trinickia caryophylli]WQE12310.1 lysophospholipid transporter LplT [Trinickia caryophylli]SMF15236.1 Major Facilitator Superfamily protein [Trinickia caryophylli]GLU31544.1 lysophospholipid transporter LplT [Trinickia caryophylli]
MKKGFYTIIAAQFVSSVADNALLIAAIALLAGIHAAGWFTPLLQIFFTVSYVVLAPFVGAFADALQKRHVMFAANAAKALGCALMIAGVHPILAYGVVGFGAAAYSPAKYGILTELLPAERLVAANAWLESATVVSTIAGTALGGALVSHYVEYRVARLHLPLMHHAPEFAMLAVMLVYVLAALVNVGIPDTGARYPNRLREPGRLVADFMHCFDTLWADKLAQIALWVTTLMWGAAVTLQLLVLKWASANLGLTLSEGALLQGVTGIGIALGAAWAAARVPLAGSLRVLPVGMVAGIVTGALAFYDKDLFPAALGLHAANAFVPAYLLLAYPIMVGLGALAGFFIVPMNALLQHRGATLITAGHSIAVQNFNQNVAVLLMLGTYTLLLVARLPIRWIIVAFGVFVCLMIWLAKRRSDANITALDRQALTDE